MALWDSVVQIVVSAAAGALAAYVTARFQLGVQRETWRRELAMKFAELSTASPAQAQSLARQFAIGVLVLEMPDGREKYFIPPGCRLVVGRAHESDIQIAAANVSKQHFSVSSDEEHVYVEDLGSSNGVYINGLRVSGRRRLETGDVISISAELKLEFSRLQTGASAATGS